MTRGVASWGRLARRPHEWVAIADRGELARALADGPHPGLAFGNGRSYGDACLNAGHVLWAMRGLDRFVAFDAATGILECEAGVLLGEVLDLVVPHGWFLPVTPGTRFVTVGGAIANDVHGKNHHRAGTFGEHVLGLDLLRTDGTRIACGPGRQPEWFRATVGGLGLTGVVERARLQLLPVRGPWIDSESEPFSSLERFFELSQAAERSVAYNVAWVDCSRASSHGIHGVFFRGDHSASTAAAPAEATRRLPVEPRASLVGAASVRAFNRLYRWRHRGLARRRQHYRAFFYPLDGILDWNRIYGAKGFVQHQSVVPPDAAPAAIPALVDCVAGAGDGSFLAVLKTFAERPASGLLSFPMAGTTLALDLPYRFEATERLLARLDAIVAAHRGRLYPAKDARMSAELFRAGYPHAAAFERFRDPGIASDMARRLFGA